MNSIQLANRTMKWVIGCSIVPSDEVIKNELKKLAKNAPPYVVENAEKRLFTHLAKVKKAYDKMKRNPDDQGILEELQSLIAQRIE